MERAPFSIYRIARGARDDPYFAVRYGPLRGFGNLKVPDWAITGGGRVRYQMVSLTGSNTRPDLALFAPPPAQRDR